MSAYYNEFDPYAAQWLRNLIISGHIAPGDVDERSIKDVQASDVMGYVQAHFFAGIGGWSLALRLAGWGDDRPVWTGSCPCQPFSVAGKGKAQSDERHLWPYWFKLIAEVRPATIFGEQVAGAIAHGWLDDAFDDLEREGYQTGAAVLPACSVGAPHKRDRLWFVGDSQYDGSLTPTQPRIITEAGHDYPKGTFETSESSRTGRPGSDEIMADSTSGSEQSRGTQCDVGGFQEAVLRESGYSHDWNTEPPVGRVANGIPARSHKLRAYGNAIVPQVAAEFIKAFMDRAP